MYFFCRPYTCFSKLASANLITLSFLFLGGFHLHANDVTGRLSGSSSLSSDPIVSSGVDVDVTLAGVIAARAWSNPETCVHDADSLCGRYKKEKSFCLSVGGCGCGWGMGVEVWMWVGDGCGSMDVGGCVCARVHCVLTLLRTHK